MKKLLALTMLCLIGGQVIWSSNVFTPGDVEKTSREIINNMLSEIEEVRTLTFTLKSWERIDGETIYSEVDGKLQESPKKKMYLLSKAKPNEGVEVLWVEGERDGEAKVNTNIWLVGNMNLDPFGKRMRKDQHHTILSTGFMMLHGIVSAAVDRTDSEAPGRFEEVFQYKGEFNYLGRQCYRVDIIDPTFTYNTYTLKEGENAVTLERDRNICAYLIVEKNDHINNFQDIEPGVTVKIPSSYAPKTTLYIDKSNFMPIGQIMSDDKGVFERYEFHNIKVNPTIQQKEFTPDYHEYDF